MKPESTGKKKNELTKVLALTKDMSGKKFFSMKLVAWTAAVFYNDYETDTAEHRLEPETLTDRKSLCPPFS